MSDEVTALEALSGDQPVLWAVATKQGLSIGRLVVDALVSQGVGQTEDKRAGHVKA